MIQKVVELHRRAGRATAETKSTRRRVYTPADLGYIVGDGNVSPMVRDYWGIRADENVRDWQREWSPSTYARRKA